MLCRRAAPLLRLKPVKWCGLLLQSGDGVRLQSTVQLPLSLLTFPRFLLSYLFSSACSTKLRGYFMQVFFLCLRHVTIVYLELRVRDAALYEAGLPFSRPCPRRVPQKFASDATCNRPPHHTPPFRISTCTTPMQTPRPGCGP